MSLWLQSALDFMAARQLRPRARGICCRSRRFRSRVAPSASSRSPSAAVPTPTSRHSSGALPLDSSKPSSSATSATRRAARTTTPRSCFGTGSAHAPTPPSAPSCEAARFVLDFEEQAIELTRGWVYIGDRFAEDFSRSRPRSASSSCSPRGRRARPQPAFRELKQRASKRALIAVRMPAAGP
jgi:hypothetical protein